VCNRRGKQRAYVAQANKNARIAWAVMARGKWIERWPRHKPRAEVEGDHLPRLLIENDDGVTEPVLGATLHSYEVDKTVQR
jgi:hypothetical protein